MKTWVRKSLKVGVLSAGIILFAGGTAQANDLTENDGFADSWATGDNDGLGSGNQVFAPIDIPIDLCGNAIGVLGDADSGCGDGGFGHYGESGVERDFGGWRTGDNGGILGGNQILADLDVPIDLCGNSVGVLGDARSSCGGGFGGHGFRSQGGDPEGGVERGFGGWRTGDNDSILGGNQILADLDVPIDLCGNSIGVLGDAFSGCDDDRIGPGGPTTFGAPGGGYGDDDDLAPDDQGADDDGGYGPAPQAAGDDDMPAGDDDEPGAYAAAAAPAAAPAGDDDAPAGDDDAEPTAYRGDAPAGDAADVAIDDAAAPESLPVFDSLGGMSNLTSALPLGQGGGSPTSALPLGQRGADDGADRHGGFGRGGFDGPGWRTGDNRGVLGGNQILLDAFVPVDVHGNAIGVGGDSVSYGR